MGPQRDSPQVAEHLEQRIPRQTRYFSATASSSSGSVSAAALLRSTTPAGQVFREQKEQRYGKVCSFSTTLVSRTLPSRYAVPQRASSTPAPPGKGTLSKISSAPLRQGGAARRGKRDLSLN